MDNQFSMGKLVWGRHRNGKHSLYARHPLGNGYELSIIFTYGQYEGYYSESSELTFEMAIFCDGELVYDIPELSEINACIPDVFGYVSMERIEQIAHVLEKIKR